jgi:hypothetical protein
MNINVTCYSRLEITDELGPRYLDGRSIGIADNDAPGTLVTPSAMSLSSWPEERCMVYVKSKKLGVINANGGRLNAWQTMNFVPVGIVVSMNDTCMYVVWTTDNER